MFNFLDKLAGLIGHEAERQNAISRFGTGMPIAMDGSVADPRGSGGRIHVDDFNKLSATDRFDAMVPFINKQAQVHQIKPEDINVKTAIELIKSSASSDDKLGTELKKSVELREERTKNIMGSSLMATLNRTVERPRKIMRPGIDY